MNTLWIVHRESVLRSQLGRLLGREAGTWRIVAGSPGGELFREAQAPAVILLGLPPHPDLELAFAEQMGRRHPNAGWVLAHDRRLPAAEVQALFAGLCAEVIPVPPAPAALAAAIARAARGSGLASLGERSSRARLEERAARWFGDCSASQDRSPLEEVATTAGPLWVRGEPGTGRLLLARCAHGRESQGAGFVHLPCSASTRLEELARRLAPHPQRAGGTRSLTVCLDGVEQLSPEAQRELRGWIELGPPLPELGATALHWWILTDDGPPEALLAPELAAALAGGEIRLAPLRERPGAAAAFARATLAYAGSVAQARGEHEPRALSEEALEGIRDAVWLGNLEELELQLLRAAALPTPDPISWAELSPDAAPAEPRRGPEPSDDPDPEPKTLPAATDEGSALARPETLRRLLHSLAHELRNPLVSIRTFAGLLPERYQDAEFRTGFREHVEADISSLENRVDRLARFSELDSPEAKPVDVSSLLLALLEEQRAAFEQRRLLVLRELERDRPYALADEEALRFAFEGVLRRALEWAGERADLYLASRHHPSGLRGEPAMRVLLRFHGEASRLADLRADAPELLSRRDSDLELLLAEDLIRAQRGVFTVDASGDEAVILIDLPAPAE